MNQRITRRISIVMAALFFSLSLLTGCGGKDVKAKSGDTVSTALFDFSITDAKTLVSYPLVQIPDGQKLISMTLTVSNTSEETYTMFAEDFQIQWGEGDTDFGTCLSAVDENMIPYSYKLAPGESHQGTMLVTVPEDCTELTVAYQEMNGSGERAAAYFVEVPL